MLRTTWIGDIIVKFPCIFPDDQGILGPETGSHQPASSAIESLSLAILRPNYRKARHSGLICKYVVAEKITFGGSVAKFWRERVGTIFCYPGSFKPMSRTVAQA